MKRFVVSFPGATPDDEAAFVAQLEHVEWWHRMPGTWLIVDYRSNLTTDKIRTAIADINPSLDILAIEVGVPQHYSARLDVSESQKTHDWIMTHWHRESHLLGNS